MGDVMPLAGEMMRVLYRGEESTDNILTVSKIVASLHNSLFQSVVNGATPLATLKLNHGVATPASKCDHVMKVDDFTYGVMELKGGDSSVLRGSSQVAAYGTHIAMKLYERGRINPKDIIVPSYVYNGMLIQFGATFLLGPSMPVYYTISKVLDMANFRERRTAKAFIDKANSCIQELHAMNMSTNITPPPSPIQMMLDTSLYYIKTLTKPVLQRSFELLCDRDCGVPYDISQGIEHWGRVLNLLYDDPKVRPHVAFPLAIRSPDKPNGDYIIIYKDLCREGYRMGAPNRVKQSALFDAYRNKLREVVKTVHEAGVIHVDLYSSNIMWKVRDNNSSNIISSGSSSSSCGKASASASAGTGGKAVVGRGPGATVGGDYAGGEYAVGAGASAFSIAGGGVGGAGATVGGEYAAGGDYAVGAGASAFSIAGGAGATVGGEYAVGDYAVGAGASAFSIAGGGGGGGYAGGGGSVGRSVAGAFVSNDTFTGAAASTSTSSTVGASAATDVEVDIVIIDWDCAHCIEECRFRPGVLEALQRHIPTRNATFGQQFDDRYVNVLFRDLYPHEHRLWTALASAKKSEVDCAFYELFFLQT
jgi:hypothetical protein